MRLLALALVLFAGSAPKASLKVTYRPHGQGTTPTVWTLKCAPAAGTHPMPGRSCLALKANATLLGPATKPCAYLARAGSPDADIIGTWNGRHVDRSYRPGCQGWNELKLVLTGTQ